MKRFLRWVRGKPAEVPTADTTIGALLLRHNFITRDQLLDAIEVKNTTSAGAMLGEVLIARGAITRSQLERVLLVQRAERGEKIDYAAEMQKLIADASARAENLQGPLDELEDAARRYSVTRTDLPLVAKKGDKQN